MSISRIMEKMIAFSDGNIHDIDQLYSGLDICQNHWGAVFCICEEDDDIFEDIHDPCLRFQR